MAQNDRTYRPSQRMPFGPPREPYRPSGGPVDLPWDGRYPEPNTPRTPQPFTLPMNKGGSEDLLRSLGMIPDASTEVEAYGPRGIDQGSNAFEALRNARGIRATPEDGGFGDPSMPKGLPSGAMEALRNSVGLWGGGSNALSDSAGLGATQPQADMAAPTAEGPERGPGIWPQRPPMFRTAGEQLRPLPVPMPGSLAFENAVPDPNVQEISGGYMARSGGSGLRGPEWAQSRTQQPQGFTRPLEELYRLGASRNQVINRPGEEPYEIATTAPGAKEMAQRELLDRVGPSEFERFQASLPLQQEETRGQYGVKQQAEQSRGALDVAREQGRASETKAQSLVDLFSMMQPGGRASIAGVGSVSLPNQQLVPAGLLQAVTAAKQQLEAARGSAWASGTPEEEEAVYRQALGQVFAQDPSDPTVQELALAIAMNPETASLPMSQILTEFDFDGANVDLTNPQTIRDLNRLLNYSRGVAGAEQ